MKISLSLPSRPVRCFINGKGSMVPSRGENDCLIVGAIGLPVYIRVGRFGQGLEVSSLVS